MTTIHTTGLIPFDDPAATDAARCGQKAATLASLRAAGFAVPDGFILTVDLLESWSPGADPPAGVVTAVTEALSLLGDVPVAVRSSGVAEDLGGASFAGAYESVLDVSGREAVLAAARRCLDARGAARVTEYRGGGAPPLALFLQPMVDADLAGIVFTADPVTGDRDTIRVSAVHGLGDRLASGEDTPDEWDVRDGNATRRDDAGPVVLDAGMAQAIAGVAADIAAVRGEPQDVEWAVAEGQIAVLQARPITVLPTPPAESLDGGGWEKDAAHFPEPMTPFGASLYVPAIDTAVAVMAERFGFLIKGLENRVVGGEVYVRVLPLFGPVEPKGPNPPAWLLGLLARLIPPMRRRMRTAAGVIESGALEAIVDRWEGGWRDEFVHDIDDLLTVDLPGLDDAGLIDHLDACLVLFHKGYHAHFELFGPYLVGVHGLIELTERLLGWDTAKTVGLLSGHSPASVAGQRELASIRDAINRDVAARSALMDGSQDPVAALGAYDRAMGNELALWVRKHGWRTANYDAGSPTLAERPGLITRLLLTEPLLRDAAHAGSPAEEARAALAPGDVALFDAALALARRVYPLREDNVILTDNIPCGLLRRWLIEAGRRLVERGLLGRADDAAYLEVAEVRAALGGDEAVDLQKAASRRRAEWAWVRAHPGPKTVGNIAEPPDMSRLPAAGRQLNGALLWAMALEYPGSVDVDGEGLAGAAASPGTYTGAVRIVRGEGDFAKLTPGDVLVCPVTTPAWSLLFGLAGAIVADGGGVLSHAAILAREYGLPAVLGTIDATRILRDGQIVTVDGTTGRVLVERAEG